MDQKITSEGTKVVAALLFFCAFLITPIGLGMLFSYPDSIWWLGLVLMGSAIAIIRSGISNLKLAKRLAKEADEDLKVVQQQLKSIRAMTNSPQAAPANTAVIQAQATKTETETAKPGQADTSPIILAHWKYSATEWKQFLHWETKTRKTNTTVEASLVLVLGGLMLMLMKAAPGVLSFTISGFIAGIYWIGKYFLSMSSIGTASGKRQNEVIITQYAVIINGKYNAFESEMYWLKNVEIKEASPLNILEITYEWQTRKGRTFDEIRVPIPPAKTEEATWLVKVLKGI